LTPSVVVFGVPSAAGAFTNGPARAPAALRAAGLVPALADSGNAVSDTGDLPVFTAAADPGHPDCRNLGGVLGALNATASAAAAHAGLSLMLGGDCSLLPGLLHGMRERFGHDLGLVYLDAHGDLNTPQTSPSGRICGMALAVALGQGHRQLVADFGTPALEPGRTALLGFRELDPGERGMLGRLGLAWDAATILRRGVDSVAERALRIVGARPFVIHLDVDLIDASEITTRVPAVPGRGLSRVATTALLRGLLGSGNAVALGVTGFDAEADEAGTHARALVEVLAAALAPA
jgi:arginase